MTVTNKLSEAAAEKVLNDEDFVRRALDMADLNGLRLALYQLTGDPALAAMRVEKAPIWCGALYGYAVASEHHAEIKARALAFLREAAVSGEVYPAPDPDKVREITGLYGQGPLTDTEFRFAYEEMAFQHFPRDFAWKKKPPANVLDKYNVLVIGAGMGGIAAAIQLERMGIPYQMIDRQDEFGGVWNQNDYPEARVDSPSMIYQYKFERHTWREFFAARDDSRAYLKHVADTYGIRDKVSFHTHVEAATWDETAKRWDVTISRDGQTQVIPAKFIISSSGVFNHPKLPDIPGVESFEGMSFHTTEWNHDYDLKGKRIALIGNGSTGVQLMPHLARNASQFTVFQRTANWITPIEGYRDEVPAELHWLIDNFPYYWNWFSYVLHFVNSGLAGLQRLDPEWQAKGGAINERNDGVRVGFENYIREKLAGRPDLIEKSIPAYPPMARRPIVDNGWYDALKQDNVELVTDAIDRITPKGVRLKNGKEYELDLMVLAGGFDLHRFLWPVDYIGRSGVSLDAVWAADGPRAHVGTTLPGFPNMFIMYGPNSQPRAGSHYSQSEIWTRYILKLIVSVIESGKDSIEVKQDAFDAYNAIIDERAAQMLWQAFGKGFYYLTEQGRSFINCPLEPDEYHAALHEPDPNAFDLN